MNGLKLKEFKPMQREALPEEEEALQGKFDTNQRKEIPEKEIVQGKSKTIQNRLSDSDRHKLLQINNDTGALDSGRPAQMKKENKTDMPDRHKLLRVNDDDILSDRQRPLQMKTKDNTASELPENLKNEVENLSGLSMDDVRVHYNSDKPSLAEVLAYTQGTDIHVASGQEKHLPHEAWQVVQQMQGRVRATTQAAGLLVNDDEGLEREADVMGAKAFQRVTGLEEEKPVQGKFETIQRMEEVPEEGGNMDVDSDYEEDNEEAPEEGGNMDADSDYEEDNEEAPEDYQKPSEYRDEFGGSDHQELEDDVRVKKVNGYPALWWLSPNEQVNGFELQGSRSADVAALGGNDGGYTWHHCADYSNGRCTMQQVDTEQHESWGHIGAASLAGYKKT